ncbi:MAG: zf-HC2 domain-containing protein [Bradymonadaceae bacterium]|nr:zf-HC2 domain-containing protein [Lujinxingiaceae bacterium]
MIIDAMDCDEARRLAFEYRRGELAEADAASVAEHLQGCQGCRHYHERLDSMLGATRSSGPMEPAPFDTNALFARITTQLQPQADEPALVVEAALDDDDDLFEEERSSRWLWAVAALVAAVVALVTVPPLFDDTSAPAHSQDVLDQALVPVISAPVEPDLLATVVARPLENLAVKVFASELANWSLTGEQDYELSVQSGTVLVEFLPIEGATLRVKSPRFEVQVIGTVFYVVAEEQAAVGVLTGKVEVQPTSGAPAVVSTGQEILADREVRPMSALRLVEASRHVDLLAHEKNLAALAGPKDEADGDDGDDGDDSSEQASAALAQPNDRQAAQPQFRAHPSSTEEQIRQAADKAMRARNYAEAARHYERLLTVLPAHDPASASVTLDLARLYRQRLARPQKAIEHLRRFVVRWPDDVATPSAREELCRLLERAAQTDPLCRER